MKAKDGSYIIFNLPFFRTFSDEIRGTVDQTLLEKIIQDIKQQASEGYFLRVFDGHHDRYENHDGIGFMDCVHRDALDPEILVTNIVGISPENFEKMKGEKGGKWPYRSAEFDRKLNKITGLALLESNAPFFQFPNMILSKNEKQIDETMKFQLRSNFFKGGDKMPDELLKTKGSDDVENSEESKDESDAEIASTGDIEKMEGEGDLASQVKELGAKVDSLVKIIQGLVESDEEVHENMGDESEESEEPEENEETEGEDEMEEKNSSVAYQLRKINKRLDKIEGEAYADRFIDEVEEVARLTNQKPESLKKTLLKFQRQEDRETFLDSLRASTVRFSTHPMSDTSKFIRSATNGKTSIIEKYQKSDPDCVPYAKEALQNYFDTCNHPDRKYVERFQAQWPDPEKFVAHCVENEKLSPGYIKKFTN